MKGENRINRRTVLKGSAAVAGAIGIPAFVSASALGRSVQPAASERLGLGFIGIGGRGRQLLSEFAGRPDVEVLGVCEVQKVVRDRALPTIEFARAAKGLPADPRACQLTSDFRELLARPDIDGVVIAAPEHWRPIMCVMAAQAGKDIFAEKPLALSIVEGKAIVETVRRYGRIFQHGTQRRSTNELGLRDACELIHSGRIGRVTRAIVSVGPGPQPDFPDYTARPPLPDREAFDWEMWLGPAPWRPWPGRPVQWQPLRDFGLRAIGNWGSHVLDMAQWAIGKDAEGPVEILPPDGPRPLVFRYADGVELHCPRTKGESKLSHVVGTAGQKTVYLPQQYATDVRRALEQEIGMEIKEQYDPQPLGPDDVRLYRPHNDDHYANWLDCMRSRKPTICNEEVAYRAGSLCCLIDLMDRVQRPLKYDPVKGEFPGDEEANRLLYRPQRSPWRLF